MFCYNLLFSVLLAFFILRQDVRQQFVLGSSLKHLDRMWDNQLYLEVL
jgi:hypothetical protein